MTDRADAAAALPDAFEVAVSQDRQFARTGRLVGPLHGVVIAVKDQYDTRDMRTTSGADADYANDRPPDDATFVARLRAAGAIILAKANLAEYAVDGARSSFGGTFCNPYDTEREPGMSSAGSGTAVAANLVTCAIGEETVVSVRWPAAVNSIVGLAPTKELVSTDGMINRYLRERGDTSIRTNADLIAKSRFYSDASFPNRRAAREQSGRDTVYDMAARMQTRFALQTLLTNCMEEQKLDALVAPMSTVPPRKLLAPREPSVNGRSAVGWSMFGQQGFPAIDVPAGFTTAVWDRERAGDSTRLVGPVAAALPVGVDFIARPFGEHLLFRIAAAYEAATKHRRPPPDFGPVP